MWAPSRQLSEIVSECEIIGRVGGGTDAGVMVVGLIRGMIDGITLTLCFSGPGYDPSVKFPASAPLSLSPLSGPAPTESDCLTCSDMSEEVH